MYMRVILYTTGCPRCKVLRMMIDKKNIAYDIHDDIDDSIQLLEFILEHNKRKDEKKNGNEEKELNK